MLSSLPSTLYRMGERAVSYLASPQAEVAGGHSVNADEQRDEPERPENILGHCFLLNRPF